MLAQRAAGLVAAQLDIVGGDFDILLAQIFGEDTADLAIADEADIPLSGVSGWGCHGWASLSLRTFFPGRFFRRTLLLRNLGFLDHGPPFLDVGLQPRLDILRRACLAVDAEREQLLL